MAWTNARSNYSFVAPLEKY